MAACTVCTGVPLCSSFTLLSRWCERAYRHPRHHTDHPRQRHPRQKGHLHRQSHRQAWHRSRRHLQRTALAVSSATPRWTEHGGVQHGARGGQTQRNLKLAEVASCLIEAEAPNHSIVQCPAPAAVHAVLCAIASQNNSILYSTVQDRDYSAISAVDYSAVCSLCVCVCGV